MGLGGPRARLWWSFLRANQNVRTRRKFAAVRPGFRYFLPWSASPGTCPGGTSAGGALLARFGSAFRPASRYALCRMKDKEASPTAGALASCSCKNTNQNENHKSFSAHWRRGALLPERERGTEREWRRKGLSSASERGPVVRFQAFLGLHPPTQAGQAGREGPIEAGGPEQAGDPALTKVF